jgi:hypothetical protein
MLATLFPTVAATTAAETGWDSKRIANLVRYEVARTRLSLPMIKLARFGEVRTNHGCLRHDGNLIEVTGCEGDYDAGEYGPEWAADRLHRAGVEGLVYTTTSHTAERPRWRVLAPFAQGREPGVRAIVTSRLNGVLGGVLAPESWGLSTAYFYGGLKGGAIPEVIRVEGTRIDLIEGLPEVGSIRLRAERRFPGPGSLPNSQVGGQERGTVFRARLDSEPGLREGCLRMLNARIKGFEEKLRNAPEGTRETVLNGAALTLGGFVWSGLLDEGVVYKQLEFAAKHCGLTGEHGAEWVRGKIGRGLRQGNDRPLSLDHVRPYAEFRISSYLPNPPLPSPSTWEFSSGRGAGLEPGPSLRELRERGEL